MSYTVRADDPYVQADDSLSVSISGTPSGGNYESLATSGTVSSTVQDDLDVTTVTLSSSSPANVTEGGTIVYSATVNNAVSGSPLDITLSNGQHITIGVGQSSGTVSYTVRADDPYVQADDSLSVSISGTPSGGNYESLATSGTVSSTVQDDLDVTTVTLSSSSPANVTEGGTIVYSATVNNAVSGSPLDITLSNGQHITIGVGQSSGTVSYTVRADDPYVQADDSLSVSISGTPSGGNYESLATSGTVSSTVQDDLDVTTVTLSSSSPANVTEGGTIVYSATVNNAVSGSPLDITLSNGQHITIGVGQSSGTVSYTVRADDPYVQADDSLSVSISGTPSGGNYESLATSGTVSSTVQDDLDVTTVTLSSSSPANVTEGGTIVYSATVNNAVSGSPLDITLSNGQHITIGVGQSSGTVSYTVRADDPTCRPTTVSRSASAARPAAATMKVWPPAAR